MLLRGDDPPGYRPQHCDPRHVPRTGMLEILDRQVQGAAVIPDQHVVRVPAMPISKLRPGGMLLIATANKDLFDFTPSLYSTQYFGVAELGALCARHGFDAQFFGFLDARGVSLRQRLLRPLKLIATRLDLVPKTMGGKEWLKRVFFGQMVDMPSSIVETPQPYEAPVPLTPELADRRNKVIYCAARKSD